MFEILRLNGANPTVGRPFRIEDLQDIWSALVGILSVDATTPKIVSGFDYSGALLDANTPIGDGVIAYDGTLYVYDSVANPLKIGDTLILARESTDDVRRLADGTIQEFSSRFVVVASGTGIELGAITTGKIDQWKTAYIAARAITGAQIGVRTIKRDNLVQPFAPTAFAGRTVSLPSNATLDDIVSWNGDKWAVNDVGIFGATTISLTSDNMDAMPDTLVFYVTPSDASHAITMVSKRGLNQSTTTSASRGLIVTLCKCGDEFVLSSAIPAYFP